MQKTDFHVLELFCRKKCHVTASMHIINSLELLRTVMLCLVQLSNEENARPQMLKIFLLSERNLFNAILRVKLKYMNMLFPHEIKCYLQCRRQISRVRAFFAEQVMLELQCTITSLELLRTVMLCLMQLSK